MEKPEKPQEPQEPEVRVLEENFFYEDDHIEKQIQDSKISRESICFHESFGYDSLKKYNLNILDDENIIYISGISYIIMNINTKEVKKFFTKDGGGIGTIAVHPQKTHFAVAEKGVSPNIYIYEYPSLRLYRILRGGTEKSYSNVCFSTSGQKFASVGSYPDYLLCVWDWKQECIQLKTKAFSQEVYRVSFSEYYEDTLISSGTGHIRFWKIAETFTGLKLKGNIAKFGQVELSDVSSFYGFPDGKVLSGTEYGTLLLWEGNFIKCLVNLSEEQNCHKGNIEVVFRHDDNIVTAGHDGMIRFWNALEIEQAEGDDNLNFYIKPNKEIQIMSNEQAKIINIQRQQSFWIVQDSNGKLIKLDINDNYNQTDILSIKVGRIADMTLMDKQPGIITVGEDSSISVYDYNQKKEYLTRKFYSKATCIDIAFQNVCAVGFENGIVRFVQINEDRIRLIKCLKIHKDEIIKVKFSPQNNIICVISKSGDIFFLQIDEVVLDNIIPYCFFETGKQITSLCWSQKQKNILVGTKTGQIMQIDVPAISDCDYTDTYLMPINFKTYTIKMMESQKPKKDQMSLEFLMKKKNLEEKIDVEWEPECILNVIYYQSDEKRVLASVDGKYLGYLYVIDLNLERPQFGISTPKIPHSVLYIQDDILFMGGSDGSYQIRHRNDFEKELRVFAHDIDTGTIKNICLSKDKKALISASSDGVIMIQRFDYINTLRTFQGELFIRYDPPEIDGALALQKFEIEGDDILDDKIYSIQQAKLLAEQDARLTLAEKIKEKVRKEIKELRSQFEKIQQENSIGNFTLLPEQMLIDPEYNLMIEGQVKQEIEETRKELAWDLEYARIKKQKLKDYVQDELLIDHFKVKALKNPEVFVQTFKLKKMSDYLRKNLDEIHQKINIEITQESNLPIQKEDVVQIQQIKIEETTQLEEVEAEFDSKLKGAKLEREKQKREEEKIKKQLEILEKSRPTQTQNAQTDGEIDLAFSKLGNYMLKSSPQYVVPERERMNVEKKKGHIFLLEEYIFNTKKNFNQEIQELKQLKLKIVDKITKYNTRIQQINQKLGINEDLFQPKIDYVSEDPQSQLQVTEDELPQRKVVQEDKPQKQKPESLISKKAVEYQGYLQVKPRAGLQHKMSQLEIEIQQAKEVALKYEKNKLLKEMQTDVQNFDLRVDICLKEKRQLERELKVSSMKLVTLYQELLIMAEMEDKDRQLIQKLSDLMKEKQTMEDQQNEIAINLQQIKENEIRIDRFLVENMKYLKELVYSDDDTKRMKILDYYRQKFKKNKAKTLKQQTEEQENEEEDDEEKEESEEDEYMSDEDEEKLDISPVENDQKTKDIVDKIVELENEQENFRKNKQDLERQKKQISTKASSFSSFLKRTEQELLDFQKEKLQKVNKLDVSFFLKLSQIQNLIPYKNQSICPDDLQKSILFTEQELQNLSNKIKEHQNEEKKSKKQHEQLKKKKSILDKQIKENNDQISDLTSKYKEKHMLKFGDLIDLKILDALEPTKQVLEMRQKFKHEERESIKKVENSMQSLMQTKKRLLDAKRENTKIINKIQQLGKQQMDLNKQLDSTNKNLFKEENEDKKNNLESEKQNLKELVTFLSKQIEDIKTEIGLFKRKGGHIYTMVTTNKK